MKIEGENKSFGSKLRLGPKHNTEGRRAEVGSHKFSAENYIRPISSSKHKIKKNIKAKILPRIVVICGPTSSGKSNYAVEYALKNNGEVISADSRQVYKGLNIGSGKITKKEMRGVPHHLLDVANPKKVFSVADFQKLGKKAILDILRRNKTPIICGGTAFYIDSLVNNYSLPEVSPDLKLRERLSQKNSEELFKILQKIDRKRAKEIDKNNKVRLIRAIEIVKTLRKVPKLKTKKLYEVLWIGLNPSKEILKERIKVRLEKRLKQGMIKEVENLHKKGLSFKRLKELGLEYRFVAEFLQGKISKEEMKEKIKTKSWHYAKRQMTWFKRNKEILWKKPSSQ